MTNSELNKLRLIAEYFLKEIDAATAASKQDVAEAFKTSLYIFLHKFPSLGQKFANLAEAQKQIEQSDSRQVTQIADKLTI